MMYIMLESYAESLTASSGLLSTPLTLAENHNFYTNLTFKKYHL